MSEEMAVGPTTMESVLSNLCGETDAANGKAKEILGRLIGEMVEPPSLPNKVPTCGQIGEAQNIAENLVRLNKTLDEILQRL